MAGLFVNFGYFVEQLLVNRLTWSTFFRTICMCTHVVAAENLVQFLRHYKYSKYGTIYNWWRCDISKRNSTTKYGRYFVINASFLFTFCVLMNRYGISIANVNTGFVLFYLPRICLHFVLCCYMENVITRPDNINGQKIFEVNTSNMYAVK